MAKDTRKAFLAKLDEVSPQLAKAFRQAINDMTSAAQIGLVEDAIARGDAEEVLRLLNMRSESFSAFDRMLDNAFYQGGVYQMSRLPKRISTGSQAGPLIIRFNGRNPRAETWAKTRAAELIGEIVDDQRLLITQAVAEGLSAGRNPRATALEIAGRMNAGRRRGGIVGLHSTQADAVARMRTELADPSQMRGYFQRARRDKRFDPTVRRALREGRALSRADIDKISGRYADRLLALRGEMIARTETQAALSAGRMEGLEQLIETGAVPREAVKVKWDATGDGRTRPDHMAMEGQEVTLGEAFTFPDGSQAKHPGDSSLGAPAKQIIGCRCYAEPKVDWLSLAR